jgi:hypothetical protein
VKNGPKLRWERNSRTETYQQKETKSITTQIHRSGTTNGENKTTNANGEKTDSTKPPRKRIKTRTENKKNTASAPVWPKVVRRAAAAQHTTTYLSYITV